jgi:uncharacterized membrane protein
VALVVLLMLVGLSLRLYKLSLHGYWDDEIITMLATSRSIGVIFSSLPDYSNTHPPFFYILMRLWRGAVGEDLYTMRLLSVVLGTACVPLIYGVGRMIFPLHRRYGLIAAAIMATAPAHILHSQQARMYPLLTAVVLISTLVFWSAWKHGTWGRWGVFGLVVGVAFYTHVYAPFSILAFNAWAAWDTLSRWRAGRGDVNDSSHPSPSSRAQIFNVAHERWQWVGLILAQLVGVLLFLPFLRQMLRTINKTMGSFWLASNGPVDWMPSLIEYANGATLIFDTDPSGRMRIIALVALVVGVLTVLLTLIDSVRRVRLGDGNGNERGERAALVLLHCQIWVPIVVATTIALTIRPILITRYLIGISPPLFLLIAWMLNRLWLSWRGKGIIGAWAATVVVGLVAIYPNSFQPNNRLQLTDTLVEAQQEGDAIAYTYWHLVDTMAFAHPGQEDFYVVPGEVYSPSYWRERMAYVGWHDLDDIQPVPAFAPRYERVWLAMTIYNHDNGYLERTAQAWLEAHGRLVEQWTFDEGTVVFLYDLDKADGGGENASKSPISP